MVFDNVLSARGVSTHGPRTGTLVVALVGLLGRELQAPDAALKYLGRLHVGV